MSYRQELLQRLRVPPLPNYPKEEYERRRRERKRKREEEESKWEREEGRECERQEGERLKVLESGSGGSARYEVTGERSKRKRTGDDDQDVVNAKRACPGGRGKTKVKRIPSLHKMAENALLELFINLPAGNPGVSEKCNQWFKEVITMRGIPEYRKT